MAFSDFKSIEDVQAKYPLAVTEADFLTYEQLTPHDFFMEELKFSLSMKSSVESEMFFREQLISPFMRQAWKLHSSLKLWINRKLTYDDILTGEPDYFLTSRPRGATTTPVGKPLLAVSEAKQEDFIEGWGQCLATMLACQKLNNDENVVVYGIVCTGMFWEFGKLEKDVFTKNLWSYSISDPARVLGILDYIFTECEKQVAKE
ncbi:MAG: hypothetical protein B6242_02345 [Anaerolineaceae bacterium 4572_78]|nr:MAG: hypothetical protein B6242_02345 [Anaerolineaceae bacterium 4572_78]